MLLRRYGFAIFALVFAALVVVSCGKKEDQAKTEESKTADKPLSNIQELAKEAAGTISIEDEFIEAREAIEAAGFIVKSYGNFPVQEVGKKGRMIVYTDERGKKSGGVIYAKKTGTMLAPSWHWYFPNLVPEEVVKEEINNDGLWDIRIVFNNGEEQEFIQDNSFTLLAKDRMDWMATNGTSSSPVTEQTGLWKCFDGDTTTAWKSSTSEGDVFIEFSVPFSVGEGILSLYTLAEDQPRECTVYADGKKVQKIELEPAAGRQMVQLDGKVRGAKDIRLEFNGTHGGGDVIAVGELALK